MKRRGGQVSIFIGIGVVILILFGTLIYLNSENTEFVTEPGDDIYSDMSPFEKYVSDCLYDSTRDGIEIIGIQGGYYKFPDGFINPKMFVEGANRGLKVPMWIYQNKYINPTREQIQEQIKMYVVERVNDCLVSDELVGEISINGVPEIEISLNEKDVTVLMKHDLSVEKGNRILKFENFYAKVDVNLLDVLKAAEYMTHRHYEDAFLDKSVINIISMDSKMPLSDVKLQCGNLFWSKSELKVRLQDHVSYLFPSVRLDNTDYVPFNEPLEVYKKIDDTWNIDKIDDAQLDAIPEGLPSDTYEYFNLFWNAGDFNARDLSFGFTYYPDYGMNFEVNPSNGDVVKSEPGRTPSDYLRFLCVNIYHFTYDIEFPFKVSIHDKSAFGNDGFLFNFGLPIMIEHNEPTRKPVNFYSADAIDTDDSFCKNTDGVTRYINAVDVFTGESLSGVKIKYDCLKYYCDLGKTANYYGTATLDVELPAGCANGFFIAEKDGYLRVKKQVLDDHEHDSIYLSMVPLKRMKLQVEQLNKRWFGDDYKASVYLNVKDDEFEHSVYQMYPNDKLTPMVSFVDKSGLEYELVVILIKDGELVGGYIDDITVSSSDLDADTFVIHPYEDPNMIGQDDKMKLYQYLSGNEYQEQYSPEFI